MKTTTDGRVMTGQRAQAQNLPVTQHTVVDTPHAIQKLLDRAMTQVIFSQPFFAGLIMRGKTQCTLDVRAVTVNVSGDIYLNPAWVEDNVKNPSQMIYILARMAMHCGLLHPLRQAVRQSKPWGNACAIVVNETLKVSRVGELVEGTRTHKGADQKSAEQLYQEEYGAPPPAQPGADSSTEQPPGLGEDDTLADCLDASVRAVASPDPALAEAEAVKAMVQAAMAAKVQGNLPEALQRLVDALVRVVTPWYDELAQYMTQFRPSGYTWNRPNRRHIARGAYMPSRNKRKTMGKVGIVMDWSGSISDREASHFNGHVNAIFEECLPEEVVIAHTTTRVAKVERLQPDDLPFQLSCPETGGTDMRVGVQHLDRLEDFDVIIILTDMHTPFPDNSEAPLVWLSTTKSIEAPIGTTIYYNMNEVV